MDFLIGPQDINLKKEIFKCIEANSLIEFKNNSDKISFWVPDKDLEDLVLNFLGYKIIQMETYFGYKSFRKDKKLSILKSLRNWYITMANSDVF